MGGLGRLAGVWSTQRLFAERLPRRRPKIAWLVAAGAPLLLTLGQRLIGPSVPPAALLFVTLLVVAIVALIGGVRPSLAAIGVGLLAQEALFGFPYGSLSNHEPVQVSILIVFLVVGGGIGIVVDELARLHAEQAALRRLSTLVARGAPSSELFAAVADEVADLLGADGALVAHLESEEIVTIVAAGGGGSNDFRPGERLHLEPPLALATVAQTRRAARTDDYEPASPQLKERLRTLGIRSSVATPIIVEGHLWGGIVASSRRGPLPSDSERRMVDFTELVATAIANAESRSELAASRARIVAASDEARRRVERDLHDGVQQRLVSIALDVRTAQSGLPPGLNEVQFELARVVDGLTGALEEVREISRGIHPAVLSEGGLGLALKTLARRAPVPVALEVRVDEELPDGVDVAAYYAVSEVVANAAKHAGAATVEITVTCADGMLHVVARDDGVGGADPARGSGLVGLRDRVEALGGTFAVRSPKGDGTTVEVALPLDGARTRTAPDLRDPATL